MFNPKFDFFDKPLLPPLYKRQQLPEGLPLTQVSVSSEISSSGAPRARAESHTYENLVICPSEKTR